MIRLSYVDIDVYTLFNEHVSATSERICYFSRVCACEMCIFCLFHQFFNLSYKDLLRIYSTFINNLLRYVLVYFLEL